MSLENKYYRDNLEEILKYTGGKHLLSIQDVKGFTGLSDPRTVRKHLPQPRAALPRLRGIPSVCRAYCTVEFASRIFVRHSFSSEVQNAAATACSCSRMISASVQL